MLGDTLRKAREEKGLSLHDIEKGTSIRTQYIDAIECGNYSALPGAVYAKGFVRNYANFLKLDADECLRQYNAETSNEPILDESPAATATTTPEKRESRAPRIQGSKTFLSGQSYKSRVNDSPQWQNLALVGLTLVVILFGGWFAFGSSFDTPDSVKKETAKNTKPAAMAQTTQNPQTAYDQKTSSDHQTTPLHEYKGNGVSINANFKGRSWMQVTVDDEVVFEGIAEDGENMSWEGKNSIVVYAGNAGVVNITENGKLLGSMGGIGEVVEKTYSKNEPTARNEARDEGPHARNETRN